LGSSAFFGLTLADSEGHILDHTAENVRGCIFVSDGAALRKS
jgi:hypothetical protein